MSVVWVVSCQLCHMVHGSLWLTHEAMHEPWSGDQGRKPQTGSQDPMTHACAPFGSLTRLLISGSEACLCERHLQTCMGFCPWAVCLPNDETVSCQGYNTKPHSAIWSLRLSRGCPTGSAVPEGSLAAVVSSQPSHRPQRASPAGSHAAHLPAPAGSQVHRGLCTNSMQLWIASGKVLGSRALSVFVCVTSWSPATAVQSHALRNEDPLQSQAVDCQLVCWLGAG